MRGGSLASNLVMSKCRGGAYKAGHMKMFTTGGKRKTRRTKKSTKKKKKSRSKKKSTKRKRKSSRKKIKGGGAYTCGGCNEPGKGYPMYIDDKPYCKECQNTKRMYKFMCFCRKHYTSDFINEHKSTVDSNQKWFTCPNPGCSRKILLKHKCFKCKTEKMITELMIQKTGSELGKLRCKDIQKCFKSSNQTEYTCRICGNTSYDPKNFKDGICLMCIINKTKPLTTTSTA